MKKVFNFQIDETTDLKEVISKVRERDAKFIEIGKTYSEYSKLRLEIEWLKKDRGFYVCEEKGPNEPFTPTCAENAIDLEQMCDPCKRFMGYSTTIRKLGYKSRGLKLELNSLVKNIKKQ